MTRPLLNIYKLRVGFSFPRVPARVFFPSTVLIVPHVVPNKVSMPVSAIVQIPELAVLPQSSFSHLCLVKSVHKERTCRIEVELVQ